LKDYEDKAGIHNAIGVDGITIIGCAYPASYSAGGILPGSRSKLQLLIINLASVF
jgi:hypothetical protein